ncbi:hypothetical protein [Burkholderia sp. RF2-non_BP3]|uniref:hypothetical protein n=1 Tax=Burkholderia sp. RF2-non_BP3 TaxID=1637844 RepID=UPI00211D4949|nr:hypothetical protein [Burkholderia sp. RF2-non_BP3]
MSSDMHAGIAVDFVECRHPADAERLRLAAGQRATASDVSEEIEKSRPLATMRGRSVRRSLLPRAAFMFHVGDAQRRARFDSQTGTIVGAFELRASGFHATDLSPRVLRNTTVT